MVSVVLLLAVIFGAVASSGCARRSSLQKKTKMYKRRAAHGNVPCPCDSH